MQKAKPWTFFFPQPIQTHFSSVSAQTRSISTQTDSKSLKLPSKHD